MKQRKKSRVLIVSFFNDWITHQGIELEIAETHLAAGDDVDFLACDHAISVCRANISGDPAVCDTCCLRRSHGLQLLSKKVNAFAMSRWANGPDLELCLEHARKVCTPDMARNFSHRGHDLGWGALSSTIQEFRDPYCSSAATQTALRRLTASAVIVFEAVARFLQSGRSYDGIYIFNGRFAVTRAAYRACKANSQADVILHERGSTVHKYGLFRGGFIHSREHFQRRIREAWHSEPSRDVQRSIACDFYEERRAGASVGWKSFVSKQASDLLPTDWADHKRRIVVFNSSEDEIAGIGDEWRNSIYGSQTEGIIRIVQDLLVAAPETHVYLRVHPNLSGVDNPDTRRLFSFECENFSVIPPDSPISTYRLMDVADVVLTFGSTTGIEATYWGRPSVLAGPSFYDTLNVAHSPTTHDEMISLLTGAVPVKPIEGALQYGYYVRTFGTTFKYWQPEHFEWGAFKGRPLRRNHRPWVNRVIARLGSRFGPNSLAVRGFLEGHDLYTTVRTKLRSIIRRLERISPYLLAAFNRQKLQGNAAKATQGESFRHDEHNRTPNG